MISSMDFCSAVLPFPKVHLCYLVHRDDEELQLLTANRQSGGERAVCTILYIIALQVGDSPRLLILADSPAAESTHADSPAAHLERSSGRRRAKEYN